MPDRARLERLLQRIDGRSYPAYRDLRGVWRLGDIQLSIDRVQGDPFASPSRVRVRCNVDMPESVWTDPDQRLAAEDWLLRRFGDGLRGERRGSGRSGALEVYRPGPEVTERSAVRLMRGGVVEVRFCVGLPARGRRVLGREASELLTRDVVRAAQRLEMGPGFDRHIRSVARQRALRRALRAAGLVAFIEDGSVLPRASGVDSRPLRGAVPFRSPPSLRTELHTIYGTARGLGVPRGVTVITGGGFHGKSTVLQALEQGHLDHVPGDGREGVVTLEEVVKVRAEDGRRVCGVNIQPFLRDLPGGRDTRSFETQDASGSTSQAAAMVEAVESGAACLLLDEDTSATNLLVRDERMRALIPRSSEPITPFVERVRQMVDVWGVSTIMVIGGVGSYLAVADVVIAMDAYVPRDVTDRAHALGGAPDVPEDALEAVVARVVSPVGLDIDKVRSRTRRAVSIDKKELDLTGVAAVLDAAHAASLGHAMRWLVDEALIDGQRGLDTVLDAYDAILDDDGVDCLSPYDTPSGFLIRPRRHEVAAALSRWRGLQLASDSGEEA